MNKKSYYKYHTAKSCYKDGKYNPDFDNYHKLGAVDTTVSTQILKVYIKSWISYLKGKKDYFDNPDKDYTGKPKEPGYKKKDGEFILIFTNEQIKFKEKKDVQNSNRPQQSAVMLSSVYMTFPKKIDNKPSKLKDLKILLGDVNNSNRPQQYAVMLSNDLDPYLLKRLMISKFDQVRIIPKVNNS